MRHRGCRKQNVELPDTIEELYAAFVNEVNEHIDELHGIMAIDENPEAKISPMVSAERAIFDAIKLKYDIALKMGLFRDNESLEKIEGYDIRREVVNAEGD